MSVIPPYTEVVRSHSARGLRRPRGAQYDELSMSMMSWAALQRHNLYAEEWHCVVYAKVSRGGK